MKSSINPKTILFSWWRHRPHFMDEDSEVRLLPTAQLQNKWIKYTCAPSPVSERTSPWWGVSEWCGRRGSSWRCPHSWCIRPPYLGWPGASRKNTGRHNTVGQKQNHILCQRPQFFSFQQKYARKEGCSGGRWGMAITEKRHWHLGSRVQGC